MLSNPIAARLYRAIDAARGEYAAASDRLRANVAIDPSTVDAVDIQDDIERLRAFAEVLGLDRAIDVDVDADIDAILKSGERHWTLVDFEAVRTKDHLEMLWDDVLGATLSLRVEIAFAARNGPDGGSKAVLRDKLIPRLRCAARCYERASGEKTGINTIIDRAFGAQSGDYFVNWLNP